MRWHIFAIGKPKLDFARLGIEEYAARLKPFASVRIEYIKAADCAGGQLAGLNFPNFTGFSGQVLNQGPDREVNLVMIKAYNDWHVDEWCGAYPGRFIPCGILPLFDVAEAAKEVKRLADKGCHAVTFSENPEALEMPSIHTKYWYPLFEAVCENKTVLCTHVGSASRSPQVSTDAPPSVQMTASSMMSMFTFT